MKTRAEFAWTTLDKDTGERWDHFKTVRCDDGVTVGEHVQRINDTGGREFRIIHGDVDLWSCNPNNPLTIFSGYALSYRQPTT